MPQTRLMPKIGHADRRTAVFVDLMCQHGIPLVAHVCSQPYSRWAPQFNRGTLESDLKEGGSVYWFLGDVIGVFHDSHLPTLAAPRPSTR